MQARFARALQRGRRQQPAAPQQLCCCGPHWLRQGSAQRGSAARGSVAGRASHSSSRPATTPRDVAARFQPSNAVLELCKGGDCIAEDPAGAVLVRDDLDVLLKALPEDIRAPLTNHPNRPHLLEVVLDLGKQPEARFAGQGGEYLRQAEVTHADLEAAVRAVGEFGADNRAGIPGTLHRISCIRNRKGLVVGLTCRVGRAVTGHTDMIRDLVENGDSLLILGRPGVGKTTVIRELARVLADEMRKRVVIVDSSNEIGGDGDVPHPAIGFARRMQVPDADKQHLVMIEAVENHMPEVVIVDEIGTEAEALACRTIAERGVLLIGTAHGRVIENLVKNPTLCDLVGGIGSVTLGDEEAARRGTQKTILERKAPPTFPIVVEIRDRALYVAHWVEDSVDALLQGRQPMVQVRERDALGTITVRDVRYDLTLDAADEAAAAGSGGGRLGRGQFDDDYDAALRRSREKGEGRDSYGDGVHEGMELLRMVSARRASVLSGAKATAGVPARPAARGVTPGGGRGGAGARNGGGRAKGR